MDVNVSNLHSISPDNVDFLRKQSDLVLSTETSWKMESILIKTETQQKSSRIYTKFGPRQLKRTWRITITISTTNNPKFELLKVKL